MYFSLLDTTHDKISALNELNEDAGNAGDGKLEIYLSV